jgi:CRISPR/Cas system Type II protein with McrA/HNH and RuvC-like nuclease domain
MGRYADLPANKAKLLKQQQGKCSFCGLYFRDGDVLEIDHITPKSQGGRDEYKNMQLLHRHCHDKKTAADNSTARDTHDKGQIIEEPCEMKVSSTVCAVRRFEISLSQTGRTKEKFLSYQLTWRRKPKGTRACWESGACPKAL